MHWFTGIKGWKGQGERQFRWRPDVIDMRKVRETAPRENLENAFEMAHKHLGIKKLLEVDDILSVKPDKRSIMTYVSQFVRAFGERRALQDGHAQYADFLEWLNVAYVMDLRREQQEVFPCPPSFNKRSRCTSESVVSSSNTEVSSTR